MTSLTVLTRRVHDPLDHVVLHVIGEVDASNATTFACAVQQALADTEGPVTIDCSRWTFVDAAGLRVLEHLGDEARRQDRLAFLANMPMRMHDLIHHTGVDRHFDLGMAGFQST